MNKIEIYRNINILKEKDVFYCLLEDKKYVAGYGARSSKKNALQRIKNRIDLFFDNYKRHISKEY